MLGSKLGSLIIDITILLLYFINKQNKKRNFHAKLTAILKLFLHNNKNIMIASFQVRKRNHEYQNYQSEKLRSTLLKVTQNEIDALTQDLLISKIEKRFFNNISTAEITEILVLTTAGFIEKDPFFDKMAVQLLLRKIYREFSGKKIDLINFSELYRKT